VNKLTIVLLSIAFVTLIAGSMGFVAADHLEPGQGIFKNEIAVEFIPTNDSNYQIYLQTVHRNGDGQLISVAEGMYGFVVQHQVTDHVFDTLMGKKEIVTIDNIKYEKALYRGQLDVKQLLSNDLGNITSPHFIGLWQIDLCGAVDGHYSRCMAVFQANTSQVPITEEDTVTNQWTILRAID